MDVVAFEWSLLQIFEFVKSVPTLSHTFYKYFAIFFLFVCSFTRSLYELVFCVLFFYFCRSFPSPMCVCVVGDENVFCCCYFA